VDASSPNDTAVAPGERSAPGRIRILLAEAEAIFRLGVSRILAGEAGMEVAGEAESLCQALKVAAALQPDVVLFDSRLAASPLAALTELKKRAPAAKVIVACPEARRAETVEFLRYGAQGIVDRSIRPELLALCVRKVAAGEAWLDNQAVNWIVQAYSEESGRHPEASSRKRLSDRELLIATCVTRGMKNRMIAEEIGTSEQVIKNYLRKIYAKLVITDRVELALYCIQKGLVDAAQPGRTDRAIAAGAG
jgi:DNA-binding NarL/FixJ family response regulator